MNIPLLIFILIVLGIIIASYSIKKIDFLPFSLLGAFIAATITGLVNGISIESFIGYIEWKALIIILSMSIITKIAVDSNILEFLAVKLFQVAKGQIRMFFFLIVVLTTLLSAIISSIVVIFILAPIIIRLCHHLKMRAGTYLAGMTLSAKIGSILTPFATGENVIISSRYGLDTFFFIKNYWIFAFILLFLVIISVDRFLLRKEPSIDPQKKKFILDLIDMDVLIKNRKRFYFNSIAILVIISLFLILPLLYLTAAIASLILILVNKKFSKEKMSEMLKDIDWEILFFLISLYIVIGCLVEAGFSDIFKQIAFENIEPVLIYLFLFLLVCTMSAFIANTPLTLILLPIIDSLMSIGLPQMPLLFVFLFGLHLGGNLIPQGSSAHITTLKIAKNSGVENLSYRRLITIGFPITLIHILCSIGFLFIILLLG